MCFLKSKMWMTVIGVRLFFLPKSSRPNYIHTDHAYLHVCQRPNFSQETARFSNSFNQFIFYSSKALHMALLNCLFCLVSSLKPSYFTYCHIRWTTEADRHTFCFFFFFLQLLWTWKQKTRNFSEWHLESQFQKSSWTYPCQYKNFLWLIST